jgi:hypothetical protein
MTVHVDLHTDPGPDGSATAHFADADLPVGSGSTYCFHVGAGGELIILIDERGESSIDLVYSPTAWRTVRGDVWRKGRLLQG